MPLGGYFNFAVDESGNVQPSPTVEVRRLSDNGLATLFSDRAGTVSLGNPFIGRTDGSLEFYVAAGAYKVTVTKDALTRIVPYVDIGLSAESDMIVANGQIKFPATQFPSADPNTLDDYEEGTFTISLTSFTNPQNLNVSYGNRYAVYTKVGDSVWYSYNFSGTYSVGSPAPSSQALFSGFPFVMAEDFSGTLEFSGVTKAGYTSIFSTTGGTGSTGVSPECSGNGVSVASLLITDISGGGWLFRGLGWYK